MSRVSAAISDAGAVKSSESHRLGLLLAATMLLYVPFFNAFTVPYPDFFSYHETAEALTRLTWPETFKRMPLFPLIIGGLARLLPGPDAILHAAQLWNLLLAPVCLWLIFRLARRVVRAPVAAAVAALCAVNPVMVYSVTQPQIELTILLTVLLVIEWAWQGRVGWAYVAAAAASLTRHEIAVVIPLLLLHDRLRHGARLPAHRLLWPALAASGFVAWCAVSLLHESGGGPYARELLTRHDGGWRVFLAGSLRVMWGVLPDSLLRVVAVRWGLWLLSAGLIGTGLALLARRHRVRSAMLLGFFMAYGAIHAIFPSFLPRYVLPVLWILYLASAVAVDAMSAGGARWLGRAKLLLVAAALIGGVASSIQLMRRPSVLTNRSTFRQVGEWYRAAARPGDKLVVTLPRIVRYYSGLPGESVVPSGSLDASSVEALLQELREKGVTYVVWDSLYAHGRGYDATRHKAHLLTMLVDQAPSQLQFVHRFREGSEQTIVYRIRSGGAP